MAIQVSCTNCGAGYSLKDELVGRRATCKKCQKPFVIKPDEPDEADPLAAMAKLEQTGTAVDSPPQSVAKRGVASAGLPRWFWPAVGGGVALLAVAIALVIFLSSGKPAEPIVDSATPPKPKPAAAVAPTPEKPIAEVAPPKPAPPPPWVRAEYIRHPEIETADLLAGPNLTIKASNVSAADFNKALGESGALLPNFNRTFSADIADAKFWPAMKAIAASNGLTAMEPAGSGRYRLLEKPTPRSLEFAHSHSIQVAFLLQFAASEGARIPGNKRLDGADYKICFRLHLAPGTELVDYADELTINAVEDDAGNSLRVPPKDLVIMSSDRNAAGHIISAYFRRPGEGVKKIARLSVSLPVEVPAKVIHAKFEDPFHAGAVFEAGDYQFKVADVTKGPYGPGMTIEARCKAAKDPSALEGGVFERVGDMHLRLVNPNGAMVGAAGGMSTQRGFVQVGIGAMSENMPPGTYLAADIPVDIRKAKLDFEFTDLELPQLKKPNE